MLFDKLVFAFIAVLMLSIKPKDILLIGNIFLNVIYAFSFKNIYTSSFDNIYFVYKKTFRRFLLLFFRSPVWESST